MSYTRILNTLDLDDEKRALRAGVYHDLTAGEAINIATQLDIDEEKRAIRTARYFNIYNTEDAIKIAKQGIVDELTVRHSTSAWVETPEVDEQNKRSTAVPRPGTW